MKTKLVGLLSLSTLILTLLWGGIIWGMARGDVVGTLDQAPAHAHNRDGLYLLTYANAALFTLPATMLFDALYAYYQPTAPGWSAVGLVFVPVYSAFNLFVYASQITIVPHLVKLQSLPGTGAAVDVFLRQMIQAWPGSAIGIGNGLMRAAGALLVLNAIACFIGLLGFVTGISMLGLGTVVGGFLFLMTGSVILMSLFLLSVAFLRMEAGPVEGMAVLA